MDHKIAEQQQAAVKYLLDELTADERKEFEEHLFDCHTCADHVRQDFTVVENLKEVLREQKTKSAAAPASKPSRWLSLLRPGSLIPALAAAAMAVILAYQNLGAPPVYEIAESNVIATVARGASLPPVQVDRSHPRFLLSFNVDGAKPDSFVCDFVNESGTKVLSYTTQHQAADSFTLQLLPLTKLFPAGRYQMVMHPSSAIADSRTYSFAIVDRK